MTPDQEDTIFAAWLERAYPAGPEQAAVPVAEPEIRDAIRAVDSGAQVADAFFAAVGADRLALLGRVRVEVLAPPPLPAVAEPTPSMAAQHGF